MGQHVWVRNFRDGPSWVKGIVTEILGPLTYLIRTQNGMLWKRHLNHVRANSSSCEQRQEDCIEDYNSQNTVSPSSASVTSAQTSNNSEQPQTSSDSSEQSPLHDNATIEGATTAESNQSHRYPAQNRKPPDRLYETLQT